VIRVAHLVSHTGTYGGERFVLALERAQRAAGIDALIVSGCSRRRIFAIARTLRALRPDIVHTHLAHAKHWGRLAAIIAGARHVVHTEHGNDFHSPLALRLLTRALHAKTECVIAFTGAQAQRIVEAEKVPLRKIAIVPNGIDMRSLHCGDRAAARAALGVSEHISMILCVGRLDAVKRYDRAVEALALLASHEEAHLYVAGDGGMRNAILAHAAQRGIEERVHLLGYRDDVVALLRAADVVLNTSQSEGMPLSLIEASCSGARIVCTPWPGAHEALGEHARIAPGTEPHAIATALQEALKAPWPDAPTVRRAQQRFAIERAAAEYVALYKDVLAHARAGVASSLPSTAAPGDPAR
jgi:glycosyltransferase involved in cell wall biosynthesis